MTIIELDHTADIRFRIISKEIHLLFEEAATALMNIMYNGHADRIVVHKFAMSADNLHELLSMFLSEVLYLSDADNIVFSEFRVGINESDKSLSAELAGAPFDRNLHAGGSEVKGISLYGLEIKDENGKYTVDLLFDV